MYEASQINKQEVRMNTTPGLISRSADNARARAEMIYFVTPGMHRIGVKSGSDRLML